MRMSIGQVSRRTGWPVETIRYFERIGLLPGVDRTPGGHRMFGQRHLQRLIFIRRARRLGFSQAEVRTLVGLAANGGSPCKDARALALAKVRDIDGRIGELYDLRKSLTRMVAGCDGQEDEGCAVIEGLRA
ncbi:MAG: MerR family transcriptional regulator [Alphaproteobacteria bacterium]|nr:MAG: MerR family transcriptional regulator [Alphaproteobacteria bacterium]